LRRKSYQGLYLFASGVWATREVNSVRLCAGFAWLERLQQFHGKDDWQPLRSTRVASTARVLWSKNLSDEETEETESRC
jgi:hypothetical protein